MQERRRELDAAATSLHFRGGCANAKVMIKEKGVQSLLNQRISFWWPYEQEWYTGVIESIHAGHLPRMLIIFDDGDSLTRTVASSIWRLVCSSSIHLPALVKIYCMCWHGLIAFSN